MPADPLRTGLCQRFGCEYPIFAFTHYPQVAAAVTNAGGVGVLGAGWGNDPKGPQALRERIRWVKDAVGTSPSGSTSSCPPRSLTRPARSRWRR